MGMTVRVRIRNSVSDGTHLYKQGREYEVSRERAAEWIRNGDCFVLPAGADVHFTIERAVHEPGGAAELPGAPGGPADSGRAPERPETPAGPKRKLRPRRGRKYKEVGGAMAV